MASDRRTIPWVLVLVGIAGLYAAFIARTVFTYKGQLVGTLFDDALISLRYAHNLASGYGLVWNPGENPPIEGYTNLAWTLVMSAVLLVFPKTIAPIVVSAIGAATLLACGLAVHSILRGLGSPAAIQIAGVAIVLTYYPLVFWTLRGMEVGLVACLLLWAVAIALRPAPEDSTRARRELVMLSTIAGVAFLTRNDSIILFALVGASVIQHRGIRQHALAAAAPLALCILAQFAFRYAYYGELVPNTYVLKLTGVGVGERLARGLDAFVETLPPLVWLTAIAGGGALSAETPRPVRKLIAIGLALVAVQSMYLVWVGGDAWVFDHSNRFTSLVVPVLMTGVIAAAPSCLQFFNRPRTAMTFMLLNVAFLQTLWIFPALDPPSKRTMLAGWIVGAAIALTGVAAGGGSRSRRRELCAAGALAATVLIPSAHAWIRWAADNGHYVPNDRGVAHFGLALRDRVPASAVLAAGWLGGPAYYSGLPAIDLFGKTDKHIARITPTRAFRPGHNKVDYGYSIGTLRPDVVLIGLDEPEVESYGYARVRPGLYVRWDSRFIDAHDPNLARDW